MCTVSKLLKAPSSDIQRRIDRSVTTKVRKTHLLVKRDLVPHIRENYDLLQLSESNAEIDFYGCLVKKVESSVGCSIERDWFDFQNNITSQKEGFCTDYEPVVLEMTKQTRWLEDSFASHGCVPSCRRDVFKFKEVIHDTLDNEFILNMTTDEDFRTRARLCILYISFLQRSIKWFAFSGIKASICKLACFPLRPSRR